MGRNWRRAFCTAPITEKDGSSSPRKCVRLGFLSSAPSTPRANEVALSSVSSLGEELHCRASPKLHCKTTTTPKKMAARSNPSSPRSPFAILKNSFRLSKSSCGVCLQSVKTGQGMAIYTAECGHTFHFPCIGSHVRKLGSLVCPVCKSTWKDVPLLAIHIAQSKHDLTTTNQVPQTPKQHQEHKNTNLVSKFAYNDDEPLLSPSMGTFVPIPEVEEDEEEVEEFRGFFANKLSSSNGKCDYLRNVEVSIMPEVAVVSVGPTHETYALVLKIKAPRNTDSAHFRAPIDLVTVLDVSDSMNGAKLQMMKRAMRLVISSLGSADRLSIVAFSACPKRLLPLRRMTAQGQRSAKRIIDRLVTSRGTSLAEALKKATKVLEDRRERNPVASIMLLSDGQDEKVQSKKGSNERRGSAQDSSTRFAHMEIPVQSFGNTEDNFTKCVSGLLSVVVQDLRIELGSDGGEISAVYSCNGRPTLFGPKSIRLGDLYAEEERELLVELRVPTRVVIRSHHVLSVKSSYKEPSNRDPINGRDRVLSVPNPQSTRSSPKIERLRSLFISTRAIAESRRLIECNELSSAHQLLASSRALLMQSSSDSAEEFVRSLEAELAGVSWRRQLDLQLENGEPLTPTSAWRAAEQLAKVARMKKSMHRVSDLHGFENARF